jgi:hypothetical protein
MTERKRHCLTQDLKHVAPTMEQMKQSCGVGNMTPTTIKKAMGPERWAVYEKQRLTHGCRVQVKRWGRKYVGESWPANYCPIEVQCLARLLPQDICPTYLGETFCRVESKHLNSGGHYLTYGCNFALHVVFMQPEKVTPYAFLTGDELCLVCDKTQIALPQPWNVDTYKAFLNSVEFKEETITERRVDEDSEYKKMEILRNRKSDYQKLRNQQEHAIEQGITGIGQRAAGSTKQSATGIRSATQEMIANHHANSQSRAELEALALSIEEEKALTLYDMINTPASKRPRRQEAVMQQDDNEKASPARYNRHSRAGILDTPTPKQVAKDTTQQRTPGRTPTQPQTVSRRLETTSSQGTVRERNEKKRELKARLAELEDRHPN